jgi:alpha-galactosidase
MTQMSYGPLSRMFPKASVELKFGIERHNFPLESNGDGKDEIHYSNAWIEVRGRHEALIDGSRYDLRLRNVSSKSIRITRLKFPAEEGLGRFLTGFTPSHVAFLRNGYQSWSTTRSYRISEKPLRPFLKLVSLATSNMANLPSNTPGNLSSEMYSVITDLIDGRSILVGQEPPFDQFFYIRLNVKRRGVSFFELIYDFGRQMLEPGESLALDGIVFLSGLRPEVEQSYFQGIRERTGYEPPSRNHRGWASWYQYHDNITPDILYRNIEAIRSHNLGFDFFLVDDGWQAAMGDWLDQSPAFKGKMREIADTVRAAGMRPGLWLAPFSVAGNSELFRLHPEYVLKNEYGKPLKAGYNPTWQCFYYGLDVTHPRFAEYLREVIRVAVNEWGFEYLKCDFLFSACLHGAAHHELRLSRSMVLKSGMRLIREESGENAVILGCGMPLSAGIGLVDTMRVGPDTGDFWIKLSGRLLRTGAMIGARNSLRNFMVRSPMHKRLWLNDPDCVMVRDVNTRLKPAERTAQMDAIAVSGGLLTYSDDFSALSQRAFQDIALIDSVSKECFHGRAIAIDAMNGEMPEIFFNTAGYVVFFNFHAGAQRCFDISTLRRYCKGLKILKDVRSGERLSPWGNDLDLGRMPRNGSRLFRIEKDKDPG